MPTRSGRPWPGQGDRRATVARLRSVISAAQPCFSGRPEQVPMGYENLLGPLQRIWDQWSPHVGRINLGGVHLGTGWRLPETMSAMRAPSRATTSTGWPPIAPLCERAAW